MHQERLLHKMLSPVMHKKRMLTFIILIMTAIRIKQLSLTELGRGMALRIQERSGIRRSDRFLGNKGVYQERMAIYGTVVEKVVGRNPRPWIIVDWSEIPNTSHHVLRAGKVTEGRAITLYEEVHPEKKLGHPKIEKAFLKRLKKLLLPDCKPIVITDAGFHNKWFREVLRLGWDYVGRVRCGKKYSQDQGKTWRLYKELFTEASATPKSIGKVTLCRKNELETHLYLFKGKAKGRSLLNRSGKKRRDTNSLDHRKSAREAWVLASSLSGRGIVKRVVKIYKKRMQIEEGFRDLKSSRYGFSFEQAASKRVERIEVLLLIGALGALIAWLTGWSAEKKKLQFQFQSNTTKTRRVLSLFYLGCQVIKRQLKIPINLLEAAINKGLAYA